jgi:hypothetical protein
VTSVSWPLSGAAVLVSTVYGFAAVAWFLSRTVGRWVSAKARSLTVTAGGDSDGS